jgi:transcriptional regulator with XRE-family HTH domain
MDEENIPVTDNTSSAFYPGRVLEKAPRRNTQWRMALKKRKRPLYFREWRKHLRLTQETVAERIDVSQNTVSRIETGEIAYTQGMLEALADAYGCEPCDLLKPPVAPPDEFSAFVMKLDTKKRQQALRILKAALGDEAA